MKKSPGPKISVVMPVYNGMPYLKEAVKSILKQSYKNLELMIVDDTSTDTSWKYLKGLKDKRIVLLKNKKNSGIAQSLNKALERVSGEYIARMDADDISLPRRLEKQLIYMQKHPEIDLCGSWVNLINDKEKIIGEKKFPTKADKVKSSLNYYTAVIHPTFFGKKTFFKNLGGYRKNYEFAEDYDLLSRAKSKYKISNVPQKLLLWRLHENRRSRTNMIKIDRTDLKIKLEILRREGVSTGIALGLAKRLAFSYLVPYPLKFRIARLLKQA